MKNAYLVVTDLHLTMFKANRKNYFGELVSAIMDIIAIRDKYKEEYDNVNLLLLGDVFDGSITNSSQAMRLFETFRYFLSNFSNTWSVVGNHELTYAQDNPYWFMCNNIHDPALAAIDRYIQPQGILPLFSLPDEITDGEVTFYFNHFGTEPKIPKAGEISIGLFHQNVGSNDICKMWGTFDDVEDAAYIQGYNYCFFGHMHLAKGKFYLNEDHHTLGEWLGTIGRTKINEVSPDGDDVNIPVIKVIDGVFQGIDDNTIHLGSYAECVDEVKHKATEKSLQLVQEAKTIAHNNFKGKTLYETLQMSFADSPEGALLTFLDRSTDQVIMAYREGLANITGEETNDQDQDEEEEEEE